MLFSLKIFYIFEKMYQLFGYDLIGIENFIEEINSGNSWHVTKF